MSSRDKNPDAFDEFELPEDPELDEAAHGHAHAHPHAPGGFEGEEDNFDFESAPEAPGVHPAAVVHHDGAFDDVEAPQGGYEDGHYVPEDETEAEHEAEIEQEAAVQRPSAIKRFGPILGIGALAVVGAGAWASGMFDSAPAPVPAAQRGAVVPPGPGPRLPQANNAPPTGQPTPPAPQQMAQLPTGGPRPGPALPGTTPLQMPPAARTVDMPPAAAPVPASRDDQDEMKAALKTLIDVSTKLNSTVDTRFNAFDQRLTSVSSGLGTRLDKGDARLDEFGGKVAAEDGRIGSVEARVAALEASRNAARPQAAATPARDSIPTAGPAARPRPSVRMSERAERAERPVEARGMHGFALRGVAAGSAPATAWVETPGGFMLVGVGQELNGAGKVTAIRPNGRSWELVTTTGVIRP